MEDVSPFVTHFAKLVWLMVHKPSEHDAQKEELRRALMQASAHPQSIVLRDLTFAASTKEGDGVVSLRELAMRMSAHSVRHLEFDPAAPVREVFEVAKALASVPTPGDEGASFDEKLIGLFLTGITAHLGSSFVRHATPGMMPQIEGPMKTPISAPQVKAAPRSFSARTEPGPAPAPVMHPANDVQAMMQVQLMRVAGRDETVKDLVRRLDAAVESPNARALVDDITRATEDLANQGKWTDVVQVLDRAHYQYARLHDGDVKRAFLMGIRRLQRPEILNGITRLIPGKREMRDTCTRLLGLAGESGADVLIDNLIGSDVAAERRAYLDALRQCPAAVKSLLHLLSDDRWYVVRNAALLLGELAPAEAEKRLAEVMAHRESRVRRAVAMALGRLGTSRALLALLQGLNDSSPDVRLQSVLAIAAARNPRAVPWIIEALEHEQDVDVQAALISALGSAPTEDGVARLVRASEAGGMLVRKPVALRIRAVEALAEAKTPSARHALQGLLSDRDREVRAAAEQAVGRLSA